MIDTYETLLDTAENAIRSKGYNAVSFRELADTLGIKSSSVHYHFKQKEVMGIALVERYSANFFEQLKKSIEKCEAADQKLIAFCNLYEQVLNASDKICLCAMLGAEIASLPHPLAEKVSEFFKDNITWLASNFDKRLDEHIRHQSANHLLATLQGAMMLATATGDKKLFDQAVNSWRMSHNALLETLES